MFTIFEKIQKVGFNSLSREKYMKIVQALEKSEERVPFFVKTRTKNFKRIANDILKQIYVDYQYCFELGVRLLNNNFCENC